MTSHDTTQPGDVDLLFRQAVSCYQRGQQAEASALAHRILGINPGHADASHLLGLVAIAQGDYVLAGQHLARAIEAGPGQAVYYYNLGLALHRGGNPGGAREAYERALALNPGFVEAHISHGMVLWDLGRKEAAVASYESALGLDPGRVEAHYNRGNALGDLGRLEEALAAYDEAIRLNPGHAGAYNNRGNVLGGLGRAEEALASYERALALNPDYAEAHNNRGNVLGGLGRAEEALAAYDRVLALNPDHAGAHNNRGSVLSGLGRLEEALAAFERALALNPGLAEAHNNRGNLLAALRRAEEALAAYDRALAFNPDYAEALNNRGNLLCDLGRPEEAVDACERAVGLDPEQAEVYFGLGNVLLVSGRIDEAVDSYRRGLEIKPEHTAAHSNLLFALSAGAHLPPEKMLEEQKCWDRMQGIEGRRNPLHPNSHDSCSGRRLRIGYVSPDLQRHPVSYFFEPLLGAHDRSRFEIFCYANHPMCYTDEVTQRLRKLADHWRFVEQDSDAGLARRIHADGIDILVDLAGHTRGNRLKAFTYRPAPIQATWLGFFAATGLEAMDYWITDEVLHPQDTLEQSVETIYRLPRCWVSYLPSSEAPEVFSCPGRDERVMLGSFCNLLKLSSTVIETWSRILHKLEGSRLLLMGKSLGEPKTQERLRERFRQHGVGEERLILRGYMPLADYFSAYAEVDIILDPFPRTGGTATAEALWMGVPVVTLAGQRYVERISASKLCAVGLQDLVTHSREEYTARVVSLAHDPARRVGLREGLRDMMRQSPLCDKEGHARAMEYAYTSMWERFLSGSCGEIC